MIIGVLTVDVAILDARSLKDKRRIVQSVKQRIRNAFNVSVSEVAYSDSHRRSRLGVAMVSESARPMHSQLDKIVDLVRRSAGLTLLDYQREVL